MVLPYKFKNWLNWLSVGPHLCTLAVAVSLNNTWRAPREAFRYGGLISALLTTVAFVGVALPVVLLQLAVGQLSQQDAVGVWRAVPFFKGIGYLRLLLSCVSAMYSMVYVVMSAAYILFTLSDSLPFWDCLNSSEIPAADAELSYDALACLNETLLAPVNEQSEYYVALAFVVIVLWILFPFILYSSVKFMKRIFYVFGPLVVLLGITVVSGIGNIHYVKSFSTRTHWINFIRPNFWHGAIVQALLSSQTAGGYLFSSGDSLYNNINVQWTTISIISTNIVASWLGVLFWFAIGGEGDKATSGIAVLVQIFKVAAENNLSTVWPLLTFAMLTLSGVITMLTFLHPIYDRLRRVGGYKWRNLSMGSSIVGAVGTVAILAIGHPALTLLEDVVVPLLLSVVTAMELLVFVFIYGWQSLVKDIEFLIETKLIKYWVMGWCAAPGIIIPFTLWWSISYFIGEISWTKPPWECSGIAATLSVVLVIITVFATISVARQVQYDLLGKLKSSFRPSRHWGPRDPITHHYWLSSREEADQNPSDTRYRRRQLGQFSGSSSFADITLKIKSDPPIETKIRSNSDDWLFVFRKQNIAEFYQDSCDKRTRSKSLDWSVIPELQIHTKRHLKQCNVMSKVSSGNSIYSVEDTNNNIQSNVKKDLV